MRRPHALGLRRRVVVHAERLSVEIYGVFEEARPVDGLANVAAVPGVSHQPGDLGRLLAGIEFVVHLYLFGPRLDALTVWASTEPSRATW